MKKLLIMLGLAVAAVACNQTSLMPGPGMGSGKIRFLAGGPAVTATVSTKATAVTASDLNTNGFKVNAVAGTAGADTEVWSNQLFEKVEDAWEQDKWWPNSDGSYRFYATYPTSYAMTFAAGGPTISASNEHDIICAYKGDATYKSVNTLAFDHIFARLSTVTVSMVSPYTISNMSIMITPKVSGTYNLYTGAGQTDGTGWSSTVEGSATNIATAAFNAGVSTTSNDIYLVPGTYTLSATWTATKDNYTQTFTNKTVDVDLVAGKTNNITASLTGDGTEIQFNVSVTAWSDNAVAAGTFPVTDPAPAYPQPIGQFTINASGDKVGFAPGNLQCTIASGPTDTYNYNDGYLNTVWGNYTGTDWGFAEHQWDFLRDTDNANSFTVGTRSDLFAAVGESAEVDTYGLCSFHARYSQQSLNEKYVGAAGDNLKTDWGEIPNLVERCGSGWRTLSYDEWEYLLFQRTTTGVINFYDDYIEQDLEITNVRFAIGSIFAELDPEYNFLTGGINGLLIFPDNFDLTLEPGTEWSDVGIEWMYDSGYHNNLLLSVTAEGWAILEEKGCVFLPMVSCLIDASYTQESLSYDANNTTYWCSGSAVVDDNGEVSRNCLYFYMGDPSFIGEQEYDYYKYEVASAKCAVRLAKDIE